jgi:transmembrane 9 superfamily protein 2/4
MASDYRISTACWAALLLCLHCAHAFYIPGEILRIRCPGQREASCTNNISGWSIKSWRDGDSIPLFVNKVYSDNTQIQYAFSELPFVCPPSGRQRHGTGLISGSNVALNLGEVLRGDRIMVSDYELEMGKDDEAHYLCSQTVDRAGLKKAVEVVKNGYVAEWIVDNLPGATSFVTVDKSRKYYASGFKMGYEDFSPTTGRPRYFINNHVTLVVRYHAAPGKDGQQGKKVIVGFEVYAKSIEASNRDSDGLPPDPHDVRNGMELTMAHGSNSSLPRDLDSSYQPEEFDEGDEDATLTIPYTYSVYFRKDETLEWANRWDLYFINQEESSKIHWLAIINSLVIFAALSAVVAVILARTIRGDIKGYVDAGMEEGKLRIGKRGKGFRSPRSPRKSFEKGGLLDQGENDGADDASSDDELPEDTTGWKLVHGDVFRAPAFGQLLAPLIGSGMQLVVMAIGLVALSCFGVLNPSFRGGFVSVGIALFILAGAFSGYFSARIYKTFNGSLWKHNSVVTATLVPGLLFATTFILNLFVWANASSTAIPLGSLIALVCLWLLIQLPLVYAGSWYGFNRAGTYSHPIKANAVPRQIPYQPWYARSLQAALVAGLIPFAVIFIELLFLFRSLWQDKSGYYYVFGFLAVVSTILILAVMETTIIGIYIQLCSEVCHLAINHHMQFSHDTNRSRRTTTGNGTPFSLAPLQPSGSSPTRPTTSQPNCTSPGLPTLCSSSLMQVLHVPSTGC